MSALGMPEELRAARPDKDAGFLLRAMAPFTRTPIALETVDLFRWQWRLLATTCGRRVPVKSVFDHSIDGPAGKIVMRIYTPLGGDNPKPAFLWCHGGAFVLGDLDSNDSICRGIARSSGAVVVAVRYRLAPDHDLYAGREDFLAAVTWVARHGALLGIDTDRLSIGGDSAGGNIAAAVAQECRRRGGPELKMQVLVYPATDLASDFPSKQENASGYFLTSAFMDAIRPLINRAGHDLTDPWLSPASSKDLSSLPPALVITAGFDPVRDDGLSYAKRLREAGVPVELVHYSGQFHGFLNFDSIVGAARDAHLRIGAALARVSAGLPARDSTLESRDEESWLSSTPLGQPLELLAGGLMVDRSVRQVGRAVARRISPAGTAMAAHLLSPWWTPIAYTRRAMTRYLHAPATRQTYPNTA